MRARVGLVKDDADERVELFVAERLKQVDVERMPFTLRPPIVGAQKTTVRKGPRQAIHDCSSDTEEIRRFLTLGQDRSLTL